MSYTYSGNFGLNLNAQALADAGYSGSISLIETLSAVFAAAGGSAPTLSGFLKGTITAAAGDLLLAHATDPFQSMGSAEWSPGFTVASSKLKLLYIKNLHASIAIAVARKATNGLPVFDAASDAVTITAGGVFLYYNPAGTAALTTGSNDALTITPASGSPTATVVAFYGP